MTELVINRIKQSLTDAESLYHRLVFLVGKSGVGKTPVLRDLADEFNVPLINVNLALSAELLTLTPKQRALRLQGLLAQVTDSDASITVLDNIEILFDQNLKQDPLRLLQGISRNRSVVASWNGTTTAKQLIYAESGHPEYRSYDLAEITFVDMDRAEPTYSNTIKTEARQA